MIGGPYGILIAALAALGLAIGAYFYGRSDGKAIERASWTEQQNSDLRTANRALDAAHRKNRDQEAQSAQKVAAVSTAYQKDLANANRTKDIAMAALRSGALVLRDPAPSSPPASGGTAEAAACPAGRDGREAGRLSDQAAEFLVSEASRADSYVAQLSACQQVIRADRGG